MFSIEIILLLPELNKLKKNKMKKLFAIALIAVTFAACNERGKTEETTPLVDSLVTDANNMADTAKMMADTATKMMADTASKMMDKAADKMQEGADKMKEAAEKVETKKP